jgi:hypothetical protein
LVLALEDPVANDAAVVEMSVRSMTAGAFGDEAIVMTFELVSASC